MFGVNGQSRCSPAFGRTLLGIYQRGEHEQRATACRYIIYLTSTYRLPLPDGEIVFLQTGTTVVQTDYSISALTCMTPTMLMCEGNKYCIST